MLLLMFIQAQALVPRQGKAMISFDEGPSKNVDYLLNIATTYRIPVVFHLDPTLESFNREVVDKIISSGFEVGMAVTDKLDEDESNIKAVFEKFTEAFISKTGYKAVLLRLPAVGVISEKAVKIAEEMGYLVTIPTLDSEDDQKSDIWPFIMVYLQNLCPGGSPLSIVFRDRYKKSINILPYIAQAIYTKSYKIPPAFEFLGKNTNLIKVEKDTKRLNEEAYSVKMSIDSTKKVIRVIALDSDDYSVRETDLPFSTENKLIVRDLLKKKVKTEEELDALFSKLKDVDTSEPIENSTSEPIDNSTNGEVHTAKQNGVDSLMVLNLLVFNFLFGELI